MMELCFNHVRICRGNFELEVDGRVRAGTLGLAGKSGSGKTSVLELLAGLRRPSLGSVHWDGRLMDEAGRGSHVATRERGVGYVSQDAELFPHLDVRGNLLFGAARAGAGAPPLDSVLETLELAELLGRDGRGLSGGQRRRVALGRALLSGPRLLLLDEPFTGLDAAARRGLRAGLGRLRRRFSIPWIVVSHERGELQGLCEVVVRIEEGRLKLG